MLETGRHAEKHSLTCARERTHIREYCARRHARTPLEGFLGAKLLCSFCQLQHHRPKQITNRATPPLALGLHDTIKIRRQSKGVRPAVPLCLCHNRPPDTFLLRHSVTRFFLSHTYMRRVPVIHTHPWRVFWVVKHERPAGIVFPFMFLSNNNH